MISAKEFPLGLYAVELEGNTREDAAKVVEVPRKQEKK